ncbi:MAG TPA: formyltransferase family protein [Ignavibacteria bacterium]|nr:formyltransferase family protein [Ignavibacteria bacterium]
MKFIYLCHGEIGYSGLKHLLETNVYPEYTFVHRDRERFPAQKEYFDKIDSLGEKYNFNIIESVSLLDFRDLFSEVDFGICAGYMEILKEDIFNAPKFGIVNLHCGKLPDYRGRAPVCRAIMNGDENLIISVHKINSKVDGGDILKEYPVKILNSDTSLTLYNRCSEETGNILDDIIEMFKKNKENINSFYQSQPPAAGKPYRTLTEEERTIDFNKSAKEIYNLVRALSLPYPQAIFEYENKKYFVQSAGAEFTNKNIKTGTIIYSGNDELTVKCKDGLITLKNVTDENNFKINISETFLQGANLNGNN